MSKIFAYGVILILITTAPAFADSEEPVNHTPCPMPADSNRMAPDHAPTPFSAMEIRDACTEGRTDRYRIAQAGKDTLISVSTFRNTEPEGTEFAGHMETPEGKPLGEPFSSRATWQELQGHASFPAARTVIACETITTPAGTFDCWRYTVTLTGKNAGAVSVFWFARTLPGPPVRYEKQINGDTVYRMEKLPS